MKTLDRYLLGELAMPFVFGVGAFSCLIFASGELFQLLDLLTRQGYSLGTIGELFVLYLPGILRLTFPMSVLLACLLGLARLSGDSEVTGLFAGGVSLYRMLWPLVGFSLLVAGATYFLDETVVPKGEAAARRIMGAHAGGKEMQGVLLRNPVGGMPDRIVFAQDFDPRTGMLKAVDVFVYANGEARLRIHSREAKWMGHEWEFIDGYQETLGLPEEWKGKAEGPEEGSAACGPERPLVGRIIETFGQMKVDLGKTPEEIERESKAPEEMTAAELSRQLELVRRLEAKMEEAAGAASLAVNLHLHYSVPFASVVFCLLGVPLGLRRQRGGASTGLGLSVIMIFAYYVMLRYCGALAKNEQLSPVLGAWLANFVAGSAGLVMLARSPK